LIADGGVAGKQSKRVLPSLILLLGRILAKDGRGGAQIAADFERAGARALELDKAA
jgi:hypothetical protein